MIPVPPSLSSPPSPLLPREMTLTIDLEGDAERDGGELDGGWRAECLEEGVGGLDLDLRDGVAPEAESESSIAAPRSATDS